MGRYCNKGIQYQVPRSGLRMRCETCCPTIRRRQAFCWCWDACVVDLLHLHRDDDDGGLRVEKRLPR
jgi:hypothetical protein